MNCKARGGKMMSLLLLLPLTFLGCAVSQEPDLKLELASVVTRAALEIWG